MAGEEEEIQEVNMEPRNSSRLWNQEKRAKEKLETWSSVRRSCYHLTGLRAERVGGSGEPPPTHTDTDIDTQTVPQIEEKYRFSD